MSELGYTKLTDRELDALITKRVFGLEVYHSSDEKIREFQWIKFCQPDYYYLDEELDEYRYVPFYSTNYNHAFRLLNFLSKKYYWHFQIEVNEWEKDEKSKVFTEIWEDNPDFPSYWQELTPVIGEDTVPRSICCSILAVYDKKEL